MNSISANSQTCVTFFADERPDYVFGAAAVVGGIRANARANADFPADFLGKNLMIQTNLVDTVYRSGVRKLLFLGSACIMPREAPQPMKEEYMLTGPLGRHASNKNNDESNCQMLKYKTW